MTNYEIANVVVTITLIIITALYIFSMLIEYRKVCGFEIELSITKDKYFELDRKIFYLEKRIAKLEPKNETEPKLVKLPITDDGLKDYIPPSKPQKEYYNIAIDEAIITDEEWKIKNPYAKVSSRMNYTTWMTIKQCIDLLSTDGKGTKQQVKEKLEELIKDER